MTDLQIGKYEFFPDDELQQIAEDLMLTDEERHQKYVERVKEFIKTIPKRTQRNKNAINFDKIN